MERLLLDLGYAISDVLPEIIVTFGLVLFLAFLGFLSVGRGKYLENRGRIPSSRVGFRKRTRTYKLLGNSHSSDAAFWQGIGTEFYGAVGTAIVLGIFVLIVQQYQSIQNRKADLILQMGSPFNEPAREAARQFEDEGWLYDGSLDGADLEGADLSGAFLPSANLSGADLRGANLSGADLQYTNLSSAGLERADLSGADLWGADLSSAFLPSANLSGAVLEGADLSSAFLEEADLSGAFLGGATLSGAELERATLSGAFLGWATLSGADLVEANLSGADLFRADLSGADLVEANLSGANLEGATLSGASLREATLPDGTTWTEETDIARFTNWAHPQYGPTRESVNARRLDQGQWLLDMRDENGDLVYPLPGEGVDEETMLERVNARRAELGLEPYR